MRFIFYFLFLFIAFYVFYSHSKRKRKEYRKIKKILQWIIADDLNETDSNEYYHTAIKIHEKHTIRFRNVLLFFFLGGKVKE